MWAFCVACFLKSSDGYQGWNWRCMYNICSSSGVGTGKYGFWRERLSDFTWCLPKEFPWLLFLFSVLFFQLFIMKNVKHMESWNMIAMNTHWLESTITNILLYASMYVSIYSCLCSLDLFTKPFQLQIPLPFTSKYFSICVLRIRFSCITVTSLPNLRKLLIIPQRFLRLIPYSYFCNCLL